MRHRWLLPVLLLAAQVEMVPARADMFQNAANAVLPDALSKLTSAGLHGDLASHPDWTAARCFQVFRGDAARPWCVATATTIGFGYGKEVTTEAPSDSPTLTVQRVVSTDNVWAGPGEAAALKVFNIVQNAADSSLYETAISGTITSTSANTTSRALVGMHIYAERQVDNRDVIFGMNVQAIDASGTNNASLVNSELDLKAGGPDAVNNRVGVDLIAQKHASYVGTDTSFFAMLRIRTGYGIVSQSPSTIENGIVIDPGASGRVLTGINLVAGYPGVDAYGLSRSGTAGILVGGTVTDHHVRIVGDAHGALSVGGLNNATGQLIAAIDYEGRNDADARTTYTNITTTIGSATAGAETGVTTFSVRKTGTLTPLLTLSGGVNHVRVQDTTDATGPTTAGFIVDGGAAIAKSLYIGGLPTSGTAVASLCISSTGMVFKKTSAGACM